MDNNQPTGPTPENNDNNSAPGGVDAQPTGQPAPLNQQVPSATPPVSPAAVPAPAPAPASNQPVVSAGRRSHKKIWIIALIVVLVAAGAAFALTHHKSKSPSKAPAATKASAPKVEGLQLDPHKNYGNKYANGLLPVGDGKYATDAPKTGYVYACSQYAQNLKTDQAGAGSRGPWFTNNNTEYDINKKIHVNGSVAWQPSFSNTVNGSQRLITSNDLPNHPTGIFPIASSDPAYAYDRNPNTISSQSLSFTLAANPAYGTPNCMGGQAGIMLTGVALFNGFDAGGRDAGAWEVQDSCNGHPEKTGEYHYHTLSSCIKDTSVSTVIGFALDGFPITGPKVGANNILTTSDLDECHGIVSQVNLDNKKVTTYHYVMTQDFPYSVSCFRATPVQVNPPQTGQGGGASNAPTPNPASAPRP